MSDYSDRSGGAQGRAQAQIYPAADEIVKRQRNEALDRCARLEADLDSANTMISRQSAEIIRLAEKLQGLEAHLNTVLIDKSRLADEVIELEKKLQALVRDKTERQAFERLFPERIKIRMPINRDDLTEEQRRALDVANSSVQ